MFLDYTTAFLSPARPSRVIKRDGTFATYDTGKISRVVSLCLVNDCGVTAETAGPVADRVAEQVDRILAGRVDPSVEQIQDEVERQLMALGEYVAAKQYVLYREKRRLERESAQPLVDAATKAVFDDARKYFTGPNSELQLTQAYDKFARFDYSKGRREVWPESVARVMRFTRRHMDRNHPGAVDEATWAELEHSLLRLEVSPSMRLIQMAGPALERCHSGVYNCAFVDINSPRALSEDLYCLMQGSGVGFSVEYKYAVDKWPRVRKARNVKRDKYVIEDDTEAWCDGVKHGVERWLDGGDYDFDDSPIRLAGSILRTKGGRASGPQPLRDLLTFTRARIQSRAGDRLTSLDLHDITCFQHRIVQMGGVRRASGIGFSDLDDLLIRGAKDGQFWASNPQRNQANNSAVYEEKPTALEFMEEWVALAKSGTGERGIFNASALYRQLPKRRKRTRMRCNPCGEVYLRDRQFCNLSIAVMRRGLSVDEIRRRVRLASIWGTIQSTMTEFRYLSEQWKLNCEEERLLGVDLLGHLDCEPLRPNAPGLEAFLAQLRQDVVDENEKWATLFGINPSAAATVGKPAGDSSCFFDTSANFKAHHGRFWVRRLRFAEDNPITKVLSGAGVPYAKDYDKSNLVVFDFPCRAPEDAIILGDMTALEQLEHWQKFKVHFTEHNPSVSIYVKPEEWLAVGHWVYENWDDVGGLSFFPYDGGVYPLAPYEAISEEEYNRRKAATSEIDWSLLAAYESEDMTTLSQQVACTAKGCEI